MTPVGQRVVACFIGGGLLMAVDNTGAALASAQQMAKTAGICG